MSQTIDQSNQTAEVITHQSSTNFLYSFLVLPRPKREAIETVYAFCRVVDDIVDEEHPTTDPRQDLNRWRDEIVRCFDGQTPTTQLGRDIKRAVAQFPIPQHLFEAMIDGMEMDLDQRRYATFEELEGYCYHVASVTGLMCIEIFGYREPSARDYAIKLGKALQMVNIMRDLKEDTRRGRVYLPQDELAQFGYSEKDLAAEVYNANFIALMRHQGERARTFFKQAREALHPTDRPQMVSAEIMGRIYFKILERIEAASYNVFDDTFKLSKAEKALVAISTWLRMRLR